MVTGPGMRTEHAMMSMFRKYDFDGSGKLEKDEFERCLKDMGIALSNLELQILCEKFDTDQDGYVQPKEFVAFMKGKRRKGSGVVDGWVVVSGCSMNSTFLFVASSLGYRIKFVGFQTSKATPKRSDQQHIAAIHSGNGVGGRWWWKWFGRDNSASRHQSVES
jgi:hypothetical protein